jgi:predicted ATP-dependent serine protease
LLVPGRCSTIVYMNIITTTTNSFTTLSDVKIPSAFFHRFKTGNEEIDEVFGKDGFVPGATYTIAAPPGSGKTTMLLQTLEHLQANGKKTVYVSGEETIYQLAFTCQRINVKNVAVANMVIIEDIFEEVKANNIDMIVLDSLPALRSKEKIYGRRLEEYLSNYICTKAKELNCVVIIVLHMTKTGTYKGTTLLPHSVDCNILMKCNQQDLSVREIQVTKNRFGPLCETAFRMTSTGFDFAKVDLTTIAETSNTDQKKSKTKTYEDLLLTKISEAGSIDLAQATQILDCALKAQNTLRNLILKAKVNKIGRGQSASWKLAPIA